MSMNGSTVVHLPGNHGSAFGCFVQLDAWFQRTLQNATHPFKVLVVGGGDGQKTLTLRQTYSDPAVSNVAHTFECVDVAYATGSLCRRFDGEHLAFPDRSQNIVFFSYVLHHAADHTLALLQEAKRVARRGAFIAVLEDLKADSTLMQRAEAVHMGCKAGSEARGLAVQLSARKEREWSDTAACPQHQPRDERCASLDGAAFIFSP